MLLQKSRIMPATKPSINDGSWVRHGLGIEVSLSKAIPTNFIGFPSVLECQTKMQPYILVFTIFQSKHQSFFNL